MPLVFGLGLGTTSVGFAVIERDSEGATGKIYRLGARIFPHGCGPKGVPLSQERRRARLRHRQLRRRRQCQRPLGDQLCPAGLLRTRNSSDWDRAMRHDFYDLRRRAFEGETPSPHEFGRAIHQLARRHHLRGRDIDEVSDIADDATSNEEDWKARSAPEQTVRVLRHEAAAIRSGRACST